MADKTFESTYKKMRWYVERDRLGLVSLQDDRTSVETQYSNLPSGAQVRIYGAKIAQHLDAETNTVTEIPEQYHEALVWRAVAAGYEIPPNQNLQNSMYFHKMYEDTITRARKWKRKGRLGGWGKIKENDGWFKL